MTKDDGVNEPFDFCSPLSADSCWSTLWASLELESQTNLLPQIEIDRDRSLKEIKVISFPTHTGRKEEISLQSFKKKFEQRNKLHLICLTFNESISRAFFPKHHKTKRSDDLYESRQRNAPKRVNGRELHGLSFVDVFLHYATAHPASRCD